MADQIATRYGILDRKLSHAALQTIVLTSANAIAMLDEVHRLVRLLGVPDTHAGHQTPRQRWEQLLRNLFPASILVVDPHGSASPDLVNLPAGSDDDERAVRRLLNAAAAFLLAETTTLEDAVDLSQHWAGPDPAGPDVGLDTAEKILSRATRASRTLLDHAESGRWRELLAAYAPQPRTPASPTHTPPEQKHRRTRVFVSHRRTSPALHLELHLPQLFVTVFGEFSAGKSRRLREVLCGPDGTQLQLTMRGTFLPYHLPSCLQFVYADLSEDKFGNLERRVVPLPEHLPAAELTMRLVRNLVLAYGKYPVVARSLLTQVLREHAMELVLREPAAVVSASTLVGDMAACADRYVALVNGLAAPPIDAKYPVHLVLTSVVREEVHRPGATSLVDVAGGTLAVPWHYLAVPWRHDRPTWQFGGPGTMYPILPESSWPETDEIFEISRPLLIAVRQMGSAAAATRLAGLAMLEAFGHVNPSQRQTVVNVLCSYLRTPPPEAGHDLDGWGVRAAVQTALADHLRPDTNSEHPPDTSWPDLDLDLTNAILTDLNLAGCHVHTARFTGVRFRGDTSFTNIHFAGAVFDGAEFDGDVVFEQVVFTDDTRFRQTTFHGVAVFEDVTFDGDARFDAARFVGRVVFTGSVFGEDVRFSDTEFSGDAVFDRVTFTGLARFGQARFFDGARFRETLFKRDQDATRAGGLGVMLLEQEPCWVRTDIPPAATPRRVWPVGWTVQPTLDQPTAGHGGRWGRLVPAQQPLSRVERSTTRQP